MACGTCDHTMQSLGNGRFWCVRCGTLREFVSGRIIDQQPKLIEFLRGFVRMIEPGEVARYLRTAGETSGLFEAILPPGERPLGDISMEMERRKQLALTGGGQVMEEVICELFDGETSTKLIAIHDGHGKFTFPGEGVQLDPEKKYELKIDNLKFVFPLGAIDATNGTNTENQS